MSRQPPGTTPYGTNARVWTHTSGFVTLTAAGVRQKLFPRGASRMVEMVSVQAAVTNVDFITVGGGTVAANNGIRQLLPGAAMTIALAEDVPLQKGRILDAPAELQKAVEIFDAAQLFMVSGTISQVLLWSLWRRQPSR